MRKLLSVFAAFAMALTILTGSIALPLLIRPFYRAQIEPLGIPARSGLTAEQIGAAFDDVMDYCLGKRPDFAAGVLSFSPEGASHFADVRQLFLLDLRVLAVCMAVLLVLCCVYLVRTGVVSKWAMLGLTAAGAAALALFGMDAIKSLYEFRLSGSGHLISGDEDRWKLLAAGVQDFLRHPLFGTGLGNTAHSALAAIVPGSMAFYHNLVAQVIGSMGIVGIFAYGVLIRDRFSLLLRGRKDPFVGAMLLSYLAMLMVSMTNPGEFCPFPNAALMVMVFSMVEEAVGAETVTVTQLRRRGALRGSTGGSYAQYK